MIQPEDNVAVVVEVGTCDRNGLICVLGEDGEGAGGIECHAPDSGRVDVVLIKDTLD